MKKKPCPFCKSEKTGTMEYNTGKFIVCQSCGARGSITKSGDEVKLWNKASKKPLFGKRVEE